MPGGRDVLRIAARSRPRRETSRARRVLSNLVRSRVRMYPPCDTSALVISVLIRDDDDIDDDDGEPMAARDSYAEDVPRSLAGPTIPMRSHVRRMPGYAVNNNTNWEIGRYRVYEEQIEGPPPEPFIPPVATTVLGSPAERSERRRRRSHCLRRQRVPCLILASCSPTIAPTTKGRRRHLPSLSTSPRSSPDSMPTTLVTKRTCARPSWQLACLCCTGTTAPSRQLRRRPKTLCATGRRH